jgi:hypothetical protein
MQKYSTANLSKVTKFKDNTTKRSERAIYNASNIFRAGYRYFANADLLGMTLEH